MVDSVGSILPSTGAPGFSSHPADGNTESALDVSVTGPCCVTVTGSPASAVFNWSAASLILVPCAEPGLALATSNRASVAQLVIRPVIPTIFPLDPCALALIWADIL